MWLAIYEFHLLFSHYMKVNTYALGTPVTKGRPRVTQPGARKRQGPVVFSAHAVAPASSSPFPRTVHREVRREKWRTQGKPFSPVVMWSQPLPEARPQQELGGTCLHVTQRSPGQPATHGICQPQGASLSPPRLRGLWGLGMFTERLLWTQRCRIAFISYKHIFLSSRWGYTAGHHLWLSW